MQRIKYYIQLYLGFVSTCFAESMNFRIHFVLLIVMDFFFYSSAFLSLHILYEQVPAIASWKREELMFFMAFMLSINQLVMTMSSEAYWRFPDLLKSGGLDYNLLKPANGIFVTFFRYIRPGSMMNVVFTVPALIYFGRQIPLGVWGWCLLPFLVILAFLLQCSIDILMATAMFWMLEGTGMNFIRMEFQQLSRWPDAIYPELFRRLFTLGLPVLLIGSGPVRWLLNPGDLWPLVTMLGYVVLLWWLVAFCWKQGLKAYESASS